MSASKTFCQKDKLLFSTPFPCLFLLEKLKVVTMSMLLLPTGICHKDKYQTI